MKFIKSLIAWFSYRLSDFRHHYRGLEYYLTLQDLTNAFRKKDKYSEAKWGNWSEAYDLLWVVLREHNIDPWEE